MSCSDTESNASFQSENGSDKYCNMEDAEFKLAKLVMKASVQRTAKSLWLTRNGWQYTD